MAEGGSSGPENTPSPVTALKKELIDPRTISKKTDPEGRDRLAQGVSAIRGLEQRVGKEITQQEKTLEAETTGPRGLVDRVRGILRGPEWTRSAQIKEELAKLKQRHENIPDPQAIIDAYYEKVASEPLSVQEKADLLKPEVLASLTTEEYLALWRRLNPHFLTHVTRQGFRDHVGNFAHSAGQEAFTDGLKSMLEDGKMIRSPFALMGLRGLDEASVTTFLEQAAASHGSKFDIFSAQNQEEAKEIAHRILDFSLARAPRYPDASAVHFGCNLPLDHYYGAEEGNEAFLVYPVDVLASQYKYGFGYDRMNFIHHANDRDFRRLGMDNDVFVWPGTLDNPGIPVDSGIVFLPKNSLVDPETGSIYASEITTTDGQEARVRLKTESVEEKFQAYISSQGETEGYFFNKTSRELLEEFSPDLLASMDFPDDAIWRFRRAIYNGYTPEQAFGRANAAWQRAQNPVSSQEYWENYFRQNPQVAPKHVCYYDNHADNDYVVSEFLQRNNIGRADTSDTEGELLGFDNNHIPYGVWGAKTEKDNDAWLGYDQLEETMLQIASRRMGQQS